MRPSLSSVANGAVFQLLLIIFVCSLGAQAYFTNPQPIFATPVSEARALGLTKAVRDVTVFLIASSILCSLKVRWLFASLAIAPLLLIFTAKAALHSYSTTEGLFFSIRPFAWLAVCLFACTSIGSHASYSTKIFQFRRALFCVVFLSLAISLTQLVSMPPYFGATFFGPRTPGVFGNPIHQSILYCACFLVLEPSKPSNFWPTKLLSVAGSLLTGGRTGLLVIALALMYSSVSRSRGVYLALFRSLLIPFVFMALYFAVSSPAISGRNNLRTVNGEDRIEVWGQQAYYFQTQSDWLFGIDLDEPVTASTTSERALAGDYVDGTWFYLLATFGLVGCVVFVLALFLTITHRLTSAWLFKGALPILVVLFFLQLSQNMFEQFLVPLSFICYQQNIKDNFQDNYDL